MIIHEVEQGSKEWLALRKGKLTGTSTKNIVAYREMLKADLIGEALDRGIEFDEKKIKVEELKEMILQRDPNFSFKVLEEKINKDFEYKMLAIELVGEESEADVEADANPLQRGHDLEPVARKLFEKAKGKKVDEVGFVSLEEESRVGLSPDGFIKNGGIYTEGLEVKCPVAWKFLKYWLEDIFPDEYKDQCLDYFVQDQNIETVYLMLYNPKIEIHTYHIFELHRKDYEREINIMKNAQIRFWKEHDERVAKVRTLAETLNTIG